MSQIKDLISYRKHRLGLLPLCILFLTSFFFEHIRMLVSIKYYVLLLLIIANIFVFLSRKKIQIKINKQHGSLLLITVLIWLSTLIGLRGFNIAQFSDAVIIAAFYLLILLAKNRCDINDCTYAIKLIEKVCIFYALSFFISPLMPISLKQLYSSFMVSTSAMVYLNKNSGICISSTILAVYTMIGLGIVFTRMLMSKKVKIFDCLELLIFVIALLNSGRRAHFAFSIIACLVIYFISAEKKVVRRIISIMFILLFLYAFIDEFGYIFDTNSAIGRLLSTINDINAGKDYTSSRVILYDIAISLFKTNPVFGIGWNGFIKTNIGIATLENSLVHSNYFQVLCECGIVGLTIFIIWQVKTTIFSFSLIRHEKAHTLTKEGLSIALLFLYFMIFFILYGITSSCLCFLNIQAILTLLLISANIVSSQNNCTEEALK